MWYMSEAATYETLTAIHVSGSNITWITMIQKIAEPGTAPYLVSTIATDVQPWLK